MTLAFLAAMRREAFALVLCACGTSAPATSTFDAGRDEVPPADYSPGPDDAIDASAPTGVACTPGSVRVVATSSKMVFDGPRIDDDFVYWTEGEPSDAGQWNGSYFGTLAVHRAGKLGEAPTRVFGTSSSITNVTYGPFFAIDSTSAYFSDYSGGFGAVVRSNKDGSSSQVLASGLPAPRELERAGDSLFFTSGTSLYSIDIDGTNERVVDTNWTAREYAVGSTHVYAIDENGDVVRVSRFGGAVERLVPGGSGIVHQGLSVGDDGYVYVVELVEPFGWVKTANVLRVSTDGKTPYVFLHDVATEFPPGDELFTTSDGDCLVYSTLQGVFRSCPGGSSAAIGPGHALEAPVVDATSIYWRTQSQGTTTIYAACKL